MIVNEIVEVPDITILFRTAKSAVPHRISRFKIRQAIKHVLFRRTAVRIDLERYSSFSSAILGLLVIIFKYITRLNKTVGGSQN